MYKTWATAITGERDELWVAQEHARQLERHVAMVRAGIVPPPG